MSWTIEFRKHKDKDDVGEAIAIFDDGSLLTPFVFKRSAQLNASERDRFVADACAARDAHMAERAIEDGYVNQIKTAFVDAGETVN